ncbi:MAG: cell division FtsA domain-containing protein [Candidatus Moranbacteria bacterium]|nr:cell division FtsA domain-containing protein [Candidatus Moranbacteria bacterium]
MGIFSRFFSKGDQSGSFLALDIGTEVVKALIFKVDAETGQGVVFGVGRVSQKLGNMQSGAVSDISGVIEASREAIAIAQEKAKVKKVRQSIIGIAGELVKGTTTTVHYDRVKPEQHIALSELKMIIQKVQEKALERIQKQLAWETNQSEIDVKLINAAIVDVRIDGYHITNPINFQGRDVSMSIFNAYAPMIHLGALESIASALDLDLLSIAAEPYAVACSVEVEDMMDFSAIFIDIGGGTTDIAVVRNGGLEGTKMFALGGRAFTRHISQDFHLSFEEAEKLKIDYSLGRLDAETAARVGTFLQEDCEVWLGGVQLSLMEFAETDVLPSKIFLCGGGSALPGIKMALNTTEWITQLPFSKPPQVGFLQPKDIVKIVDTTGELINPQDITPMGLANLALGFVHEEKMLAGLLRKTVQTIQK